MSLTLTARIPECQRAPLAKLLAPVFWIRRYLDELDRAVIGMIWSELIKDETHEDGWVHLVAFGAFSLLCLFSYHSPTVPYLILLLAFLPVLEWLLARHGGFRAHQSTVTLQLEGARIGWTLQRKGRASRPLSLPRHDVRRVVLEAWSCGSTTRGWILALETQAGDRYPVAFKERFFAAWRAGQPLSLGLKQPLQVLESHGRGSSAEFSSEPYHDSVGDWMWSRSREPQGIRMQRNFKTLHWKAFVGGILEQSGYYLFLVVMVGVMGRYGAFLTWMLGPRLGLTEPTPLRLDLSFTGILGFFTPTVSLVNITAIAMALCAIGITLWQLTRPQALNVNDRVIQYKRPGQRVRQISTSEARELLVLYEPSPLIILIGHESALVIDGLGSDIELDEVHAKLREALKQSTSGMGCV